MSSRTQGMPTFLGLPPAARVYVGVVVAAGAAALIDSAMHLQFRHVGLFVVLIGLAVLTSAAKIDLPLGRSQSNLSLSHAVNFWALLALGPAETVCIAAVGAWAQCTLRSGSDRNPMHRIVFSISTLTLTSWTAGLPLAAVMSGDPSSFASLMRTAAVVAPLYFFVNSALVAGAIAFSTRQSVARIWQRNFVWSAPSYLVGATLAAVATAASSRGWFGWLAVLAVPLYLVFRSYHTVVARLREEQDQTRRAMDVQLATIEALALAIEARAGCTPDHIRSIQHYAGMLAEAAGLSDEEVQGVRTAALLHDIGNMAVPEHILSKPDSLTPEEFERVKIHPRVGAEILRNVSFGAPVSELVLSHHERWDGLGYPAGLHGDDIPLGARVLAIADCYSTLQATRPYRPARSESAAVKVLREFSGTAFDPALVELFVARLNMTSAPSVIANTDDTDSAWIEREGLVALQDIAGAHREEQTLYEIAQALGSSLGVTDAMALIQEKVSRLVPFVTCALFLGNDDDGYECRYAHGPGTEALFKWQPKSWSEVALRLPACADGRGAHGNELTSLLPCPLTFEGRLIGGLVIYHTAAGCFTDEHRRVLGRVSEQAAAVIFNSTRFEQTQHESHTDPLTGLSNRRSLDRQFETGLAHATRTRGSISVVVLDMDRLKEINDTYGHEAGDRALRAIGAVLKSTVRQNDLCARFAGDEFVVVLWDCSPENEARRMQELQAAVGAHPFEPRPGVRVPLSISAGPARFPVDGSTFEELLAAADARMYRDKAGRRSRNSGRHAAAGNEGA
jgi:diguanylate cyclase (GGDEF)-like protein/putative nucleotidyltransferase with HDIG domain